MAQQAGNQKRGLPLAVRKRVRAVSDLIEVRVKGDVVALPEMIEQTSLN
jgi:hypothetical protein